MKAVTLWQPWASLIALGLKSIETRRHNRFASLKGQRIAIHAGYRFDSDAFGWIAESQGFEPTVESVKGVPIIGAFTLYHLASANLWVRGCVIATADVADVRMLTADDSKAACCAAEGLYGLVLRDVRPVLPIIPHSGRQGIWEWKDGIQDVIDRHGI